MKFWNNLPPMVRHLLSTMLTVILSGGAMATSSIVIDPDHFNSQHLKHLGLVFAAGALMGLLNWLRQKPWEQFGKD